MLAASPASSADVIQYCLILLLAIAVLAAGVFWVRRRLFSTPTVSSDETWSLQHLRDLRSAGQISPEEYDTLKAQLLASVGATTTRNNDASESTRSDDAAPPLE